MEVYVEVVYILNCILLFFTLEILFFLLNCQIDLKKLFQYVLTYNISLVFLYVDLIHGFILFYFFIITLLIFKKEVYIFYPLFLFIYVSIITFINRILPSSYIFQGILLVESVNEVFYGLIIIMIISLFYFYIYYCKNKLKDFIVDVEFESIGTKGLIDTGHNVFYKGYPVIFINKKYLLHYKTVDTLTVNTVLGNETLDIVVVKNIKINKKIIRECYVALIEECEFDCIINYETLGGYLCL